MKALIALLLAGKFGKLLLSGGTMLASLWIYAMVYGWRYAAGFILLLFTHEMGHYIAARQHNLNVGLPTFIPFVGAWIQLKEQFMSAETGAYVGIAGPMLGSAAAFLCYLVGRSEESPWLLAVSYAGFVLNLFNLIPISPLDGGRIVQVISPKIWIAGVPLLVALFLWKPSPLLIIIAIIAVPQAWRAFRQEHIYTQMTAVPTNIRVQYALQYLLLAAGLAIMAFEVHGELSGKPVFEL